MTRHRGHSQLLLKLPTSVLDEITPTGAQLKRIEAGALLSLHRLNSNSPNQPKFPSNRGGCKLWRGQAKPQQHAPMGRGRPQSTWEALASTTSAFVRQNIDLGELRLTLRCTIEVHSPCRQVVTEQLSCSSWSNKISLNIWQSGTLGHLFSEMHWWSAIAYFLLRSFL